MTSFILLLLKKAIYRAKHRGGKEADFLLGGFVEAYGTSLNEDELFELNLILEYDDDAIFSWLSLNQKPPVELKTMILEKLRNHLKQQLKQSSEI
jgi:antitoxin CptB